ncbi:MAG TPA: SUMF1/EgtB/PvdO family nonheme iron enzyme [Anaerolineales bacterium]|nr:SUMF1/EgtB/PvdO family nonheme iron enzyme [Anaerolineales bacterium]
MSFSDELILLSKQAESILGPPFEWCLVTGGAVILLDASDYGGTTGGTDQVLDFAIAKYLTTNGQYQKFIEHPNGFGNPQWWEFSPQGIQWRKDHRNPKPTAFAGTDLPRTRTSWFDSVAFCRWLSAQLNVHIRLPTEQEWQRAAVGDTGWSYPWGNELDETRGNFANQVGRVSTVGSFPRGQSPFGVMDMTGNLSEWCLTTWATDSTDLHGYTYRVFRGGAWNISNPEYLRAIDRGEGHSPRGQLNDRGFRMALQLL